MVLKWFKMYCFVGLSASHRAHCREKQDTRGADVDSILGGLKAFLKPYRL